MLDVLFKLSLAQAREPGISGANDQLYIVLSHPNPKFRDILSN